jgi:hypothetical protein
MEQTLWAKNFNQNWTFSEQYIGAIKTILQANAMHIVNVEVATPEEDMKHSTDLKVRITSGDVAVRIRRGNCSYRDITIRAFIYGHKTEIDKLREGYGDWYLYAWENPQCTAIQDWVLLDINAAQPLFSETKYLLKNNDKTGFFTYHIKEFERMNAVRNSSSVFWN